MNYFENLNEEVRNYFHILCPNDFPYWLEDYISTPAMQRIGKISLNCGMNYTKLFKTEYWYSNLDHSVGVALIIWNFTQDKKMTLSGLFHDIATPVFKHCIDFMNEDYENQESTEDLTYKIISDSKEIMKLLKKDHIKIYQVCDYKLYSIADNKSPMLSADRFEYNFSSGLSFFRIWDLDKISKIYNDIIIVENELGESELAFKTPKICEQYILTAAKLWPCWVCDKDRTGMQFIADMCKSLSKKNYLTKEDLYIKSEQDIVDLFANVPDEYLRLSWLKFTMVTDVFKSEKLVADKYCVNVKTKMRYLNLLTLVNNKPIRIYDYSFKVKEAIDNYINMPKGGYYTYFDFEFNPYK